MHAIPKTHSLTVSTNLSYQMSTVYYYVYKETHLISAPQRMSSYVDDRTKAGQAIHNFIDTLVAVHVPVRTQLMRCRCRHVLYKLWTETITSTV